jgi:hypothetical protein
LCEAIGDEENKRFVYLSDTCVPLLCPDQVYKELIQNPEITFMDAPRPWQDQKRYKNRLEIGNKHFFKHSGWFTLCLADARKLVQSKKWFNVLNTIQAGDEHILSILNESQTSNLVYRPITYVHWDIHRHDLFRSGKLHRAFRTERNPRKKKQIEIELEKCRRASKHPVAWETKVTGKDLERFLQSGCLFARKFLPGCDVQVLMETQTASLLIE